MAANVTFSVGVEMDKKSVVDTQKSILDVIKILQRAIDNDGLELVDLKQHKKTVEELKKVYNSLGDSYSETLKKFNMDGFIKDLKKMGVNIDHLQNNLEELGVDGYVAMEKFTRAVKVSNQAIAKSESLLKKTGETLNKTFVWSMANRAVDTFVTGIRSSINFVYDLDESLNNIRVVTGLTADEMADFAKQANEVAQTLGQTTTAYTEGSLLYLQQGKTMQEAMQLTEATLIGANITGERTADVAELLTAALNGYNLEAKDAMDVTDKFANVGAKTGSDFNELATAFSKTASMASIVGVTFDQLTAQIATISTVTREAPESIGTSLKTIYGRMTEIKDLGSDEEGMTFGAVKETLDKVSISVVDANDNLRDMGLVIEEVGDRWTTFNRNTQVAIANALAGSRQANRLIALFQNWEMYQNALEDSVDSSGAAMEQNEIRMDSLEYKTNQLRASFEELFMELLNSDAFKGLIDGLVGLTQGVTGLIQILGGATPIVTALMSTLVTGFAGKFIFQAISGVQSLGAAYREFISSVKQGQQVSGSSASQMFKSVSLAANEATNSILTSEQSFNSFINSSRIPAENVRQLKEIAEGYQALDFSTDSLQKQRTRIELLNSELNIQEKLNVAKSEAKKAELSAQATEINAHDKIIKSLREELELKQSSMKPEEYKKELEMLDQINSTMDVKRAKYELTKAEQTSLMKETDLLRSKITNNGALLDEIDKKIDNNVKSKKNYFDVANKVIEQGMNAKRITDIVNATIKLSGAAITATTGVKSLGNAFNEVEGRGKNITNGITNIAAAIGTVFGGPLVGIAIQGIGNLVFSLFSFETSLEKVYKKAEEFAPKMESFTNAINNAISIDAEIENANALTTAIERKRALIEVNNKIAELSPELITGYDLEGNALISLTGSYEDYMQAQKSALYNSEGFEATVVKTFSEIKKGKLELSDTNKALKEYLINPMVESNEAFQNLTPQVQNTILQLLDLEKIIGKIKSGANPTEVSNMISEMLNNSLDEKAAAIEKLSAVDEQGNALISESSLKMIQGAVKALKLEGSGLESFLIDLANSTDNVADLTVQNIKEIIEGYSELTAANWAEDWMDDIPDNAEEFMNKTKMSVEGVAEVFKEMRSVAGMEIDATSEEMAEMFRVKPHELERVVSQMVSELNLLIRKQSEGTLTDEEQSLFEKLIGLDKQKLASEFIESLEEMERLTAEFKEGYQNPLEFTSAGELDTVIDKYQELVAENETLVGLFNDANTIAFRDGHPFSETFAEFIDGNLDSVQDYEDALMTFNEMFEDMSDKDLTEMFGADFANTIQEMLQIDIASPFEEWSLDSKAALEEVFDNFSTFEEQVKGMYVRLKSDDSDFYTQLRKDNYETFEEWDKNFDLSGKSFQNMAEYQLAVDQWKYVQMNNLSNENLERVYQAALAEGLISQETNESVLKGEQTLAQALVDVDSEKLRATLDLKKEELIKERDILQGELDAAKEALEKNIELEEAGASDTLTILDKQIDESVIAVNDYYFGLNRAGMLAEAGISTISATGVANTTVTAKNKISQVATEISALNDSIAAIEEAQGALDKWLNFKPSDLEFNIDAYNPTNAPTTNAGGYSPSKDSNKKEEKDVEDLEFKKDLYHDINIELQKTENLLTKLSETEDDLYGQSKINNMEKQVDLLRKQKQLSEQRLAIAKEEAANARNSLQGMGVKFDESGAITNYNDILQQKTNWANSLTGDAKKEAQEYVNALRSAMESYEDLQFNVIMDYESELEELREAIQAKILEAIDYKYQIKVDVITDFQEDNDFFNEILEGYEGIDQKILRTTENFREQFGVLAILDEKYKEILNDTELDAITKAEAIEELKKQIMDATLELKDLKEAISDLIQDAIKNNLDAIYDQIDAFESVNDEIKDMMDMYELMGGIDLSYINEMIQAQADSNEAQIDALKQSKKHMEDFRDSLEEGTDEWKAADEAVKQMDSDIRKLALDTMKLYREQLENSFTQSLSSIEKALTGGLGFDKLEDSIKKAREEQEKYYDTVEKSLFAAEMQKKIQGEIAKTSDPKKQATLQKFYDEQIATLLEKDNLTASEVERAKILYDITLKQMALEDAKANKSIMRLVRDASGNWSYQYMADISKVQEAQDDLSSSMDELLQHDKEAFEKTEDEILARRKQFLKDMEDAFKAYMSGEIGSQEELMAIVGQLQTDFNNDMLLLNSEYAQNEYNLAESTLGSIMNAYGITFGDLNNLTEEQKEIFAQAGIELGDSWESTITGMTQQNESYISKLVEGYNDPVNGATAIIKDEFGKINQALTDYGNKMDSVSQEVGSDLGALKDKTQSLKDETQGVIDKMQNEFTEIKNNILPAYQQLIEKYDTMISKIKNYITELNNAIAKNKELANSTPSTSVPNTGGSGSGGGSSSSGGSGGGNQGSPGVGSVVTSVPGTWYSDSYSGAPTGNPYNWAKQFKITSHKTDGRPRPYHVQGTNGGTGSGWVEWVGFKSGGYTGDWSKSDGMDKDGGKMALLHQKEMVLNAEDTENMLKAVNIVRDYSDILKQSVLPSSINQQETIQQNVTIQADFSGVKNSNEIETAFDNLVNKAIQYAKKN